MRKKLMNKISKTVLILATSLLFNAQSYAGDYARHTGLSINIGNHHNGFSLSYKAPVKHHAYKHQKHNHALKTKHGYKHKYNNDHKYYKKHKRGYNKPYRYKQSHHYYDYRAKYTRHTQKAKHHYNRYDRRHTRSCHPVSKTVRNHYGRYQDIGGTMCHDRGGHAYIVPGSRYKIR